MRAIRPQRTPPTDSQHQLSRRYCISRAQLEEELKLRTRLEEAYAEQLAKLTVSTRVLDFMQVQFSSDTQDEVFTSSWIKKLEVLVGDADISRATQMSRVGKLEAQYCQIMSVELVWRSPVDHATTVSAGI